MQTNSVFRFSTDAVPAKDRLAVWREVIGEQYMSLDMQPDDSAAFRADVEVHHLPSTQVTILRSTPMQYTRTSLHAQNGDSDFTFAWMRAAGFHFAGEGEEATFHGGDAVLLPNHRTGTVFVADREPITTVRINGTMLRAATRNADERLVNRINAGSAPFRLLSSYIDTLLQVGPLDPALGFLTSTHIVDLLALSLGASEETRERARDCTVPAARLMAIRADIMAHLGEPGLSAKTIAQRQGVSERYVHLLFERSGMTVNRFITGERLKQAMAMLLDPALAPRRISDIAFAVGFGDLTTFNRAFRQRFGDTPRAIRAVSRSR